MKKQQDEGVTNTVVVILLLGGLGYWFYQQNQTKIEAANTAKNWWDAIF
jgi:hypothetical protein